MDVAPAETGMDAATAAPETDPMNSRRVEMFGVMSWRAWFEGKENEQQIANQVRYYTTSTLCAGRHFSDPSPKAAIAGAERVLDIRTQSCQFRPTICN